MPPRTFLEAIQWYPDIYVLTQKLSEPGITTWGIIPNRVDFHDRPVPQLTLKIIPSATSRLEEAYRQAVKHAYPYVMTYGTELYRPVTLAIPDQYANTASEVLDSLIEQVSEIFGCNDPNMNSRSKLEMMRHISGPTAHHRLELTPLVHLVDVDRAISDTDTLYFIEALKRQVTIKHGGRLMFYTGTDIALLAGFLPPRP